MNPQPMVEAVDSMLRLAIHVSVQRKKEIIAGYYMNIDPSVPEQAQG